MKEINHLVDAVVEARGTWRDQAQRCIDMLSAVLPDLSENYSGPD
jgi:hypothetical protein